MVYVCCLYRSSSGVPVVRKERGGLVFPSVIKNLGSVDLPRFPQVHTSVLLNVGYRVCSFLVCGEGPDR